MTGRTRNLITSLYVVVIVGLTLAPVPVAAAPPQGLDKWVHAAMFGGLAALVFWSAEHKRRLWLALGFATLAAGLIELMQVPIAYRSGDVRDFVAGVFGAALGAGLAAILSRD